ncbi:hypothetical protein BN1013_02367 [Candidatus Rubidus massiliensis]|nr:hypothetical protein BN1013_02367 [Candidatus Rubidus massiliensis]
MPNVRHEESLDGCILPETIHSDPAYASNDQTLEDEQISKSDGHVYKSQYREDMKSLPR